MFTKQHIHFPIIFPNQFFKIFNKKQTINPTKNLKTLHSNLQKTIINQIKRWMNEIAVGFLLKTKSDPAHLNFNNYFAGVFLINRLYALET